MHSSRWADRAATKDVGEDGGALDVLDHERDHGRELVLAEGVAERARPVDVIDGRVGVLKLISTSRYCRQTGGEFTNDLTQIFNDFCYFQTFNT